MPKERWPALRDWALFLDIDGTLLDLAPKPDQVVVPGFLPPLLAALSTHLHGALALISGRALGEIDRLIPGGFDAAGSHGAQWRRAGIVKSAGAVAPELDALVRQAGTMNGILVERKPASVALHYRDAPEREAALRVLASRTVASAPALRVLEGKSVIEVVPVGANKGVAIARFMTCPPFAGRLPVFVGDDVTDEAGFAIVNKLGGLSVHVGTNPATRASRKVHSPAVVLRWLVALEHKLRGACHGQS